VGGTGAVPRGGAWGSKTFKIFQTLTNPKMISLSSRNEINDGCEGFEDFEL
jgi:hypothetical protein